MTNDSGKAFSDPGGAAASPLGAFSSQLREIELRLAEAEAAGVAQPPELWLMLERLRTLVAAVEDFEESLDESDDASADASPTPPDGAG